MTTSNTFQVFLDGLQLELAKLPKARQLAFGAACCERALPNYAAFSSAEHWGEPSILRAALDTVWGIVAGAKTEPNEVSRLERECHAVTPHSDDFGSVLATAGQAASISIQWLLRYCLADDPKCGFHVASDQRDAIDCFVQDDMDLDPMDPKLYEKIEAHPFTCVELEKQKNDLAYLKQGLDLVKFCQEARKVNESNIGLPSVPAEA